MASIDPGTLGRWSGEVQAALKECKTDPGGDLAAYEITIAKGK